MVGMACCHWQAASLHGKRDCEIIGLNISREQVRQGRELIARAGLAARVDIGTATRCTCPCPTAASTR
jgi:cyclopropane fatty-acyl-phospholipid synthase-like methyltransferase